MTIDDPSAYDSRGVQRDSWLSCDACRQAPSAAIFIPQLMVGAAVYSGLLDHGPVPGEIRIGEFWSVRCLREKVILTTQQSGFYEIAYGITAGYGCQRTPGDAPASRAIAASTVNASRAAATSWVRM
jgi:hypothetical protein